VQRPCAASLDSIMLSAVALCAGLVWERVSAVSKASVDNKACLFAALAKVMAVMQDTLREVRVAGSRHCS